MMKSLPVQSNSQLVKGGNHIYLSSYTGNKDSSCHHRMETARLPSAMFQHYMSRDMRFPTMLYVRPAKP